MIDQAQVDRLYECDMVDANGEKIGSVKQIWVDDSTGRPLWAEVNTGLFGMKDTFVPIQNASIGNDQVIVPMDKRQVKDSPHISVQGGHMTDEQQDELYRYYGIIPTASTGEHDRLSGDKRHARRQQGDRRQAEQRQTDQRQTEQSLTEPRQTERRQGTEPRRGKADATAGMTRHEEQLTASTRDVEVGRVRLVKHVVTEEQNITVPVSHEEVRVVREPMDGTGKADSDAFTDSESEVTLHRQEAVVEKTVKPVERVRLEKETVTEQQQVSGKVRKERLDIEDDTGRKRR